MDEDDTGVVGKTVRVSILKHLQSFRKSPAAAAGGNSLRRLPPKLQHQQHASSSSTIIGVLPELPDENITTGIPLKEDKLVNQIDTVSSCGSGTEEEASSGRLLMEDACKSSENNRNDISESEITEQNHEMETHNDSHNPSSIVTSIVPRENVIRPINRDVVHQICSGQVIVTLTTAVKELVENSIDAGATKIDIRLVEYGSKLIEVSDNACGIEETNFEGLALKHHTSKIAQFEDLGNLSTFGFRGEALSSLCALANFTIVTRHMSSEQKSGYKIEYDYRGIITSKVRCARDFGTSVVLKDLFHTLPVRHKEFIKNLKKEYHRMVNVLYGYCLVVDGVRITCTNQIGNGAPQKVLAVPAYNSMKERIVTLFGSKQLSSLVEIKQCEEISEEILGEFGLNENTFEKKYTVEGYISKPNQGRSSNDRQFYFINSRPCDPAKISRVINEVYHTFSRQQNPFVCLHIKTNRENVDINVTPDKRTLYIQNEKILLATVKASLLPILTASASSYNPINSLSSSQLQQSSLNFTGISQSQKEDEDESLHLSSSFEIESGASIHRGKMLRDDQGGFDRQYSTPAGTLPQSVIAKTNNFIKSYSRGSVSGGGDRGMSFRPAQVPKFSSTFKRSREDENVCNPEETKQAKLSGYLRKFEKGGNKSETEAGPSRQNLMDSQDSNSFIDENASQFENVPNDSDNDDVEILYDDEIEIDIDELLSQRKSVSVSVNWKSISLKLITCNRIDSVSSVRSYARNFRAKIAPEDNSAAEEELKKQLTKDMFQKMEIVGQFNLGFIVVKNGPDLFIVDQHASDEKYNYEDQEKSTVLNGQLLIRPLDLELPAISENIIMDHIDIFQKNGFDFIISPDEEPRKRVKMLKIPFSKNIEFGKSDVEELIFMLEDGASGKCFYRPTKVREMFASRACRKSVMIGTALNPKEMRQIIDHMGEMDQPWNCPHGRPTIRHLINLNLLPDLDLTKFNH